MPNDPELPEPTDQPLGTGTPEESALPTTHPEPEVSPLEGTARPVPETQGQPDDESGDTPAAEDPLDDFRDVAAKEGAKQDKLTAQSADLVQHEAYGVNTTEQQRKVDDALVRSMEAADVADAEAAALATGDQPEATLEEHEEEAARQYDAEKELPPAPETTSPDDEISVATSSKVGELIDLSETSQEIMRTIYDLRQAGNERALESFLKSTVYNKTFLSENPEIASELFHELATIPSTRSQALKMVEAMISVNKDLAVEVLGYLIQDDNEETAEEAAKILYELTEEGELDIKTDVIPLFAKRAKYLNAPKENR
jgi:hypothetical protein